MKVLKIFFSLKKYIYIYIPLVLSIEENSLRPELSSPPCFRIQGGWSERYGGRTKGRKFLCLILDYCTTVHCSTLQCILLHFTELYSTHYITALPCTTQYNAHSTALSALHRTVQHSTVHNSAVQHHTKHCTICTAQNSAVQHCTEQCSAALHRTVQYSTAENSAVQHCTEQCSTALHRTVQYSTAQNSAVQHCT